MSWATKPGVKRNAVSAQAAKNSEQKPWVGDRKIEESSKKPNLDWLKPYFEAGLGFCS
jgi:hypothetical protein